MRLRRMLLAWFLAFLGIVTAGDDLVHAARCTPLEHGQCRACKNCRYCRHCAKQGGKCSVCAPHSRTRPAQEWSRRAGSHSQPGS
jgi:hypothetical protein